jgi:hypothetical protein
MSSNVVNYSVKHIYIGVFTPLRKNLLKQIASTAINKTLGVISAIIIIINIIIK